MIHYNKCNFTNNRLVKSFVFSDNRNPTNWTSGVKWTHGSESVKNFTYDQIRIDSKLEIISTEIAKVYLRSYKE